MLAVRLIQLVETHAEELVRAVFSDVRVNGRTPSFTRVPETDLHHRLHHLYRHFGDWIGDPVETRIESQYIDVGRRRYHEEVPLAELVYALTIAKEHLQRFLQQHGLAGTVVELYSEEQLHHLVDRFFDRAIYFAVKGYEDERLHMAQLAATRAALERTRP